MLRQDAHLPRGSHHELTGLLLTSGPHLVLQMADGGEWRLDAAQNVRHLLGKRVTICGSRDDFDLLYVTTIVAA